jgi:hypothetical protein
MSMRPVHATEGWGWARAAKRRLADAQQPSGDPIEATDRDFDLAQAVTAFATGSAVCESHKESSAGRGNARWTRLGRAGELL